MPAQMTDGGFLVPLVQQLVLVLGLALAGANMFALYMSARARTRYEADLAAYKAARKLADKSKRLPKPEEPKQVRLAAAVVNIVIGLGIAIVAGASLTLDWIG